VLAGVPGGADGIDTYDAACVAFAEQHEEWTKTDFVHNPKADEALFKGYRLREDPEGAAPAADPMAELAEMRARLERSSQKNPDDPE
jgi:hypothetical protein